MNRGEIRQKLNEELRDTPASPTGWTVQEQNEYIDDTYQEVAFLAKTVTESFTLTATPNNHFVPLPARSIGVYGLVDVASGCTIDHRNWRWIDQRDWVFIRTSGDRPHYAAAWGTTHLLVYPAYLTGGTIDATCAVVPEPLGSDSAVPAVPKSLHMAIVHGAVHRCLVKDAHDEERMRKALDRLEDYNRGLGEVDAWSSKRNRGIFQAIYGARIRGVTNPRTAGYQR